MKNRIFIISLFLITLFSHCSKDRALIENNVHISGKVLNFDKDSSNQFIDGYQNDFISPTFTEIYSEIDSVGNFAFGLNIGYPQSIQIRYGSNFQLIVRPGDSLYLELDGSNKQFDEILETINFKGNAAQINKDLLKYQILRYQSERPSDMVLDQMISLEPNDFIAFINSSFNKRLMQRDSFINEVQPSEELIRWIDNAINIQIYLELLYYPDYHKMKNKLSDDWEVGKDYYKILDTIPQIIFDDLIYSPLNEFISGYTKKIVLKGFNDNSNDKHKFNKIVEFDTNAGLLKQLILVNLFNSRFKRLDVSLFETETNKTKEIVTNERLMNSLVANYQNAKSIIRRKIKSKDQQLIEQSEKSGSELWQGIINENRGKVIYIDCWGTWCGGCIAEFPYSRTMMEKYGDSNIEFIYLCFNSKKYKWEEIISTAKLKGKHYLLTNKQDDFFVDLFKVNGYPTYVIIDREGKVKYDGFEYRPSHPRTSKLINELLYN